jgi:hypothetical protein
MARTRSRIGRLLVELMLPRGHGPRFAARSLRLPRLVCITAPNLANLGPLLRGPTFRVSLSGRMSVGSFCWVRFARFVLLASSSWLRFPGLVFLGPLFQIPLSGPVCWGTFVEPPALQRRNGAVGSGQARSLTPGTICQPSKLPIASGLRSLQAWRSRRARLPHADGTTPYDMNKPSAAATALPRGAGPPDVVTLKVLAWAPTP